MQSHSPATTFRIILCRSSHPGNIGAAARAIKNMGLHQLILVNPLCKVNDEAYARASGATDILDQARICNSLEEALADSVESYAFTSRRRDRIARLLPLREAVQDAYQNAIHGKVAFVFGNETNGLNTEELSACKTMVYIPANPDYASLNLAAAVQLLSYEVYVAQTHIPTINYIQPEAAPAQHHQVVRMIQSFEQVLISSGYLDPNNPKQLMPRLQRFFHRARVEEEEVHLLTGIFETIRKKLS
ncbi:MAG: RNA methyltransferase [Pseudomonadota bacterium]